MADTLKGMIEEERIVSRKRESDLMTTCMTSMKNMKLELDETKKKYTKLQKVYDGMMVD